METKVYNLQGEEVGKIDLPESIFGLPWNASLVKQAVLAQQANSRNNVANTKGRGEVSGGGKKPWRQKGTGRARHGSIRSPIWVGGGVTHGPTNERNFSVKINKNMRRKALLVSLSAKMRDNEIVVLDTLDLAGTKTKDAVKVFKELAKSKDFPGMTERKGRTLVALPSHDEPAIRSMRNMSYVASQETRNLNVVDLLSYKYVVFPKDSIKVLQETFLKK